MTNVRAFDEVCLCVTWGSRHPKPFVILDPKWVDDCAVRTYSPLALKDVNLAFEVSSSNLKDMVFIESAIPLVNQGQAAEVYSC